MIRDTYVTSSIAPIFVNNCKQSPHFLLYISITEWGRCKDNSIHATGLFKSAITSYDNTIIGINIIAPLKRSTTHGMSIQWQDINLSEISRECIIITTSKDDLSVMIRSNSVTLIDSTEGSNNGRAMNAKFFW